MLQYLPYVTNGTRELFRGSLVWWAYNKQQDTKRALAYMCRRFDVARTQKVVGVERPSY